MGDWCEFEITSEMIDSGADALAWHDVNDSDPRRIVVDVLAAMGAVATDRGFVFRTEKPSEGPQSRMRD